MKYNNMTIADVAGALGVSKTTVSRAISGKGRIGEETRRRVLEYVEQNDYRPSALAKGLAQSKTCNLCVVMPRDYELVNLPYFQDVIAGIEEVAGVRAYDILLCLSRENDIASLSRILGNRKADGVILLRSYRKDLQIELLEENQIPFVVAGSTDHEGAIRVDFDSKSACRELTSILMMRSQKKIALIGQSRSPLTARNRYLGFMEAYEAQGLKPDENLLFLHADSKAQVDYDVEEALEKGADCILCMDDGICIRVLRKLRLLNVRVPQDVRVASFYNSTILENNTPTVTSLDFDTQELGREAARNLLAQLAGNPVQEKTLLPYEVVLKESTM